VGAIVVCASALLFIPKLAAIAGSVYCYIQRTCPHHTTVELKVSISLVPEMMITHRAAATKLQESGRVVECYPDVFAIVNGKRYLVGHPCDW
jgi:hypothetical protein